MRVGCLKARQCHITDDRCNLLQNEGCELVTGVGRRRWRPGGRDSGLQCSVSVIIVY